MIERPSPSLGNLRIQLVRTRSCQPEEARHLRFRILLRHTLRHPAKKILGAQPILPSLHNFNSLPCASRLRRPPCERRLLDNILRNRPEWLAPIDSFYRSLRTQSLPEAGHQVSLLLHSLARLPMIRCSITWGKWTMRRGYSLRGDRFAGTRFADSKGLTGGAAKIALEGHTSLIAACSKGITIGFRNVPID